MKIIAALSAKQEAAFYGWRYTDLRQTRTTHLRTHRPAHWRTSTSNSHLSIKMTVWSSWPHICGAVRMRSVICRESAKLSAESIWTCASAAGKRLWNTAVPVERKRRMLRSASRSGRSCGISTRNRRALWMQHSQRRPQRRGPQHQIVRRPAYGGLRNESEETCSTRGRGPEAEAGRKAPFPRSHRRTSNSRLTIRTTVW